MVFTTETQRHGEKYENLFSAELRGWTRIKKSLNASVVPAL